MASWGNPTFSLSTAAVAVFAGGMAIAAALLPPRRKEAPPSFPPSASPVRQMFSSGHLGREDLVLLLDRIERTSVHPRLPPRPTQELRLLVALPAEEFRRYLDRRITEIETGS